MSAEKREYFRLNDSIPVSYERIENCAEEKKVFVDTFKDRIAKEATENTESTESTDLLFDLLASIDRKLDTLISKMNNNGGGTGVPAPIPVNLSASGIRFNCKEDFDIGETLKLNIYLPPHPYDDAVYILGEVVRVLPCQTGDTSNGHKCCISIKFVGIDEGSRLKIMRYLLDAQRKTIRQMKGNL